MTYLKLLASVVAEENCRNTTLPQEKMHIGVIPSFERTKEIIIRLCVRHFFDSLSLPVIDIDGLFCGNAVWMQYCVYGTIILQPLR
mmetsp:Transcript_28558/g.77284  ORF Transcript_28558/g.77284 Transcript_28558/m.77284 type:complete len:86 (-) Transcript_28558:531-788(-)